MARVDGRPRPVRPEPHPRGRARRVVIADPPPEAPRLVQPVTTGTVAAHVRDRHGFPAGVLAEATEDQLITYHEAEHRFRSIEFLGHTHDPKAAIVLSDDDAAHQQTLRRIAEGKNPPDITEILERVDTYIEPRRAAGDVLSPYDRRCLEIAQAVAQRAARLARRRGGNAA